MRLREPFAVTAMVVLLTACSGGVPLPAAGDGQRAGDGTLAGADQTAEAFAVAAEQVTQTVAASLEDATAAAQVAGGGGDPSVAAATPESGSPMPVISSFDCDPCSVTLGSAARLAWQVEDAEAVLLDGKGVVAPGEQTVYPDQTTTYRLVATNAAGRSEKTVTVEVPGLPKIHYFTCLPCEIHAGDQAVLSWDLAGGTAVYLDGEGVPAPGSIPVAPDKTTTYRLEAVSDQGSVIRLVTVTVLEGGTEQAVQDALGSMGYDVRGVTELRFESGESARAVVMSAADTASFYSHTSAEQVFRGLGALADNFASPLLAVGLYDGDRFTRWVTVGAEVLDSYRRGDIDGVALWRSARYDTWDEWAGRWITQAGSRFSGTDFGAKDFQR